MLIDIVKGMSNLASHPNVTFINVAAGPEEIIDVVLRLLQHKNDQIFSPMVKYVGGIMSGDNDILTSAYLQKGVLEQLGSILFSSNSSTVKEALWGFSNVLANFSEDHKYQEAFINCSAVSRVLMLANSKSAEL